MRKQFVMAILFGAMSFGTLGGALAADPATGTAGITTRKAATDVEVTLTGDTREVQVSKGYQLKVAMEGNPTTGYDWEIEYFKPSLLELTTSEFTSAQEKPASTDGVAICGAGGMKTFVFRAKKSGKSPLIFWYKHPWEDGKPAKTFTLNVEIKEQPTK